MTVLADNQDYDACARVVLLTLVWLALVVPRRCEPASIGQEDGPASRSDEKGEGAEPKERLDPLFRVIDPARLQRAFDEMVGLDSGEVSRRPEASEIGEPVFFDLVRPLGDRKYSNELNYLFNSSTRNAPGLEVIEYESTFGDWRAAEIDLSYFNGNLEILTPFYQRTLGVGRRRNWVHGLQLSPDLYLRSGFVGGTAVYALGWKPEEKSKFSSLVFLGANRAIINGFHPTPAVGPPVAPGDRVFGAWRPTVNVDLFHELSEKFTLGFEADQFLRRGKAGEFVDFPFLTYKAGRHAFFQAGGGYYRFESRDQFTFFLHLNFVNPSTRRSADAKAKAEAHLDPEPDGGDEPGPIRRTFSRLLGDR